MNFDVGAALRPLRVVIKLGLSKSDFLGIHVPSTFIIFWLWENIYLSRNHLNAIRFSIRIWVLWRQITKGILALKTFSNPKLSNANHLNHLTIVETNSRFVKLRRHVDVGLLMRYAWTLTNLLNNFAFAEIFASLKSKNLFMIMCSNLQSHSRSLKFFPQPKFSGPKGRIEGDESRKMKINWFFVFFGMCAPDVTSHFLYHYHVGIMN